MDTLILTDLEGQEIVTTNIFGCIDEERLAFQVSLLSAHKDLYLKLKYDDPFILKTNIYNMPFIKVIKCLSWETSYIFCTVLLEIEKVDNLEFLEEKYRLSR